MKNLKIVLMLFSFLIGSSVQSLRASDDNQQIPPILNTQLIPTGYGITKLLKRDYFLASLLIDKSAIYGSADDIIYIDAARRMEFKFVADRKISGRTFGRQMATAIKINNIKNEIIDSKTQIQLFMKLFRRSIVKGDVIRFDYHEDFGTRAYQNNHLLGEIPYSKLFYRLLLRVWLGERPPSSQFKAGILGQNGDDYAIAMQNRYQSL